ncbi:MAG: DedA family protein [Desulfuromonadales bacterium]|nr:DedA family protein [Desulfuromonadales bacterium]
MKFIRSLYDWVLKWSKTPYAGHALFFLALLEASFFPIPPDVLLIAMSISLPERALFFAALASCGSVLGGALGYLIGLLLWSALADLFFHYVPGFTPELFTKVQGYFAQYDFLVIFAAGFSPIPYKVFTIGAGVFDIGFLTFMLASVISRSARFFLEAWLLKRYGIPMQLFIDRYFNWLAIGFTVLLFGGFVLIKMMN